MRFGPTTTAGTSCWRRPPATGSGWVCRRCPRSGPARTASTSTGKPTTGTPRCAGWSGWAPRSSPSRSRPGSLDSPGRPGRQRVLRLRARVRAAAVHGEAQRIGGRSMESLTGQLLVATPALQGPELRPHRRAARRARGRAARSAWCSTGPPRCRSAEVLGGWGALAGEPAVLFEGGPVQPESAICLARIAPRRRPRWPASAGWPARSARSTCPPTPTRCASSVLGIRVFAGYAGWSPGQLEDEIDDRLVVRRSTPCRATRSPTARTTCGRWCCAARAASWRRWPTTRPTRRSTEPISRVMSRAPRRVRRSGRRVQPAWAGVYYCAGARAIRATWGRGAAGSAPHWQCGGQGFESPRLHP